MKSSLACWLALLGIVQSAGAAPAWPTPPRAATGPTTTASSAPQEIEQNLALLKGNNAADARKLGATRLLEIGGPDAAGKLAAILQHKSPDLAAQMGVCAAIADFPYPSPSLLEPLLELLGDPRPGLQEVLIPALNHFDRSQLVDRLRPMALDRSQARPKRLAAINALGTIDEEKNAVAALVSLLDDPGRSIRAAALAAFAQATGIAHEDPPAAMAWWEKHSQMSPVDWLRTVNTARNGQVRAMSGEKSELTRRLTASYRDIYLHTPESSRSQYLQSLLKDVLPAVRLLGLDLINDLITDRKEIDQELKSLIAGTLADPDPKVRMMAARMVSDLRLTVALAKLTDAIGREMADEVRAAQVAALGRLDDLQAVPTLTQSLSDESALVVGEAATALGNLARRGRAEAPISDAIIRVLVDRFQKTPRSELDLREKLLLAMGNVDAPDLRPIFERELRAGASPGLRRAAIAGLAAAGDPAVAATIRPLLASSEPDIRIAVLDALAKCGRSKEDLDALSQHLGPVGEPDPAVRQRAWDSFLAVLQHASPNDRLTVADSFNLPNDKTAQRRRLDILKSVKADAVAYEAMSPEQRIDLLEQMARVQLQLAEFAAAAATLEQATGLLSDPPSARYATLSAQCVAALLKGREDDHALRRIEELTDGQPINGELSDVGPLGDVLRDELAERVASAENASDLDQALKLATLSTEFAEKVGADFAQELAGLRSDAIVKRDQIIDGLLSQLAGDPEAEGKLMKDNPQAVLSRIYQKLAVAPAAPSGNGDEERLVRLARRIAPQWQGYSVDTTPEKRAASLNDLRERCAPARQDVGLDASPDLSTSAPVEKRIGLRMPENSDEQ